METVILAVMSSLWGYDARVHLDSVPSFTYEDVSQGFQLLVEAQACGSLPYWSVEGDGA